MKYPKVSGLEFIPWQPSTWPDPPDTYDSGFNKNLERIFKETILEEIKNVISDAQGHGQGLVHRGHVVAIAILCAIDAISSYAFQKSQAVCPTCGRGDRIAHRYKSFIAAYFPRDYRSFSEDIYNLYRNSMVHSWNLFKVSIRPGNQKITLKDGVLSFGLLNFFTALKNATNNFLLDLAEDPKLQTASLLRYRELKNSALP